MNLRDFVKQALIDIHGGIQDADEEIGENTIAPPLFVGNKKEEWPENVVPCRTAEGNDISNTFAQLVEFEVCVTSSTSGSGKGKAGLEVLDIIKIGKMQADVSKRLEKSNQIRFVVPMRLDLLERSSDK